MRQTFLQNRCSASVSLHYLGLILLTPSQDRAGPGLRYSLHTSICPTARPVHQISTVKPGTVSVFVPCLWVRRPCFSSRRHISRRRSRLRLAKSPRHISPAATALNVASTLGPLASNEVSHHLGPFICLASGLCGHRLVHVMISAQRQEVRSGTGRGIRVHRLSAARWGLVVTAGRGSGG